MAVEITNPWSGRVEYRYDYMGPEAIERRLAAAEAGARAWQATPLEQRVQRVQAFAQGLRRERERLGATMTAEMGKLAREAQAEIEKSARAFEHYAEHGPALLADVPVASEARRSLVRFAPIGCVLAVMPWNFPVWQVVRFLAPALVAGNTCLLKHATTVPRCADLLEEIGRAAGLPEGVFGVVHIDNAQAAQVIADARIRAVTLTGSERAGRAVAANAGQHLKKCVLELGGSDPFLVLEDADLARAVEVAVASRFGNAGQTCIAAKRFIPVGRMAAPFLEALEAAVRALAPGDPLDPQTTLAPMARADLRDGLHDQVRRSVAGGARVLVGGAPVAGHACAYPATVLEVPDVDNVAFREELFGPVAAVLPARDEEDAVRIANASSFGLGATVFGADRARAEALGRRLEVGSVFVNSLVRSDVRLPFGGTKQSGFGRELAAWGMHEFMNIQTVWVE